jgi:hypothetical protein
LYSYKIAELVYHPPSLSTARFLGNNHELTVPSRQPGDPARQGNHNMDIVLEDNPKSIPGWMTETPNFAIV